MGSHAVFNIKIYLEVLQILFFKMFLLENAFFYFLKFIFYISIVKKN